MPAGRIRKGNFDKCNALWGMMLHHLGPMSSTAKSLPPIPDSFSFSGIETMQQSLSDFVDAMEKAGFLVRIKDEMRVDEVPEVMEANPTKAVLVEKIKDSEFSVLANAYSNQEQFAWAHGLRQDARPAVEMVELGKGRIKSETSTTAPCKEVILNGDDVDLTRLPLFLHHDRDGHAYTNDNLVHQQASRHRRLRLGHLPLHVPDEEREVGRHDLHLAPRSASTRMAAAAKGQNLEVAIVLGGPTDRQDLGADRRHHRHRRLRGARRLLRRARPR